MHTQRIGVIDRLGYTWCLKCERRARTTETTDVMGEVSTSRAAYSPQLSTEADKCDGCCERMLDQLAPPEEPSWSVAEFAVFHRRRYGNNVRAEVDADGELFLVTGGAVRRV
jgi:hypothetical protein